jgi:hypothetical protein
MPDFSGAVLLGTSDTRERHERKQLTNLIRVGRKLAVLGVEDNARAMGWWHIVRPGSHGAPQGNSWGPDQEGNNLVHGKALCGRTVVSNGYPADWRPPPGTLCPACAEQI